MRFRTLGICALVITGAGGLSAGRAAGFTAPQFDTDLSSITLTHAADTLNAAIAPVTVSVNPPPSDIPSGFQINHTFTNSTASGDSSTTAIGAVSELTNSFTTEIQFKAGTGVTQTNVPGLAYSGPSALRIGVNTDWILPSGFPDTSLGLEPFLNYTFPVGGVIGIGGRNRFTANLSIVAVNNGSSTYLGTVALDRIYTNSTGSPLPFTDNSLTGSVLLNNGVAIAPGSELLITGEIDLRAKNDQSPSTAKFLRTGSFGVVGERVHAVPLPSTWAMGLASLIVAGMGQRLARRGRLAL